MVVVSPRLRKRFERTDDVALYDIVSQFASGFAAVVDALAERTDPDDLLQLMRDRADVRQAADAVVPGDRQAALRFIERWTARAEGLQKRLSPEVDEHSDERSLVAANRS